MSTFQFSVTRFVPDGPRGSLVSIEEKWPTVQILPSGWIRGDGADGVTTYVPPQMIIEIAESVDE